MKHLMEGDTMPDTNFSLLSQEEIDTLIKFLRETSDSFGTEVLSQDSIDKLIAMMRGYGKKLAANQRALESVRAVSSVLDRNSTWTLEFEENAANGFMEIFATDGTHKEFITPKGYSCGCFVGDDSSWGYTVSPVLFTEIAKVYGLKFSKDVYNNVCQRFLEKNFGDTMYDVDDFFMASGKDILTCLLDN